MKDLLQKWILAGLFVFLCILSLKTLFQYRLGAYGMLMTLATISPIILVLFIAGFKHWAGIVLGCLAFEYTIPLPLLQRLYFAPLFAVTIGGLYLLKEIMQTKTPRVADSPDAALLLVGAGICLARFLVDRPGSAMLGAQYGGAGEAVMFLFGFAGYFLVCEIVRGPWNISANFRNMSGLIVIAASISIAVGFARFNQYAFLAIFQQPVWFLSALLLSVLLDGNNRPAGDAGRQKKAPQLYWATAAIVMLLAVMTPHRSRPVFALAIILSTAYAYNKLSTAIKAGTAAFLLVLLILLAVGSGRLPFVVMRSVSTIIPVPQQYVQQATRDYGFSGETGWRSGFRAELFRLGWMRIKRDPLFGKGFKFSQDDLMLARSVGGDVESAARGLAVTGAYHNAILELIVFCGIPAGVLVMVAYIKRLLQFLKTVRRYPPSAGKKMAVALFGYFAAMSGQMLMNGGAQHFAYVMILLGAMKGMGSRLEQLAKTNPQQEHRD